MSQADRSLAGAVLPQRPPLDTVFVDRDGVINANRPGFVGSWEEFEFLPGALDALALFARHGLRVVVVTNQACIGRSLLTEAELEAIHARMVAAIREHGGDVAAVLACPHAPEHGCTCRKPEPGMLREGQALFGIEPTAAVMIGDHLTDLQAAHRAGSRSILVLSGRTPAWTSAELPDGCIAVLEDLWSAANYLISAAGFALPLTPIETFINPLDLPDSPTASDPTTTAAPAVSA
jgi:D-glycero-D-manno-heptose 1,7-bisphosphate phosphatase